MSMTTNVFVNYEKQFHQPWPKMIPQDVEFAQHCLDTGMSIDDLPDSDSFIQKYFSENIIY